MAPDFAVQRVPVRGGQAVSLDDDAQALLEWFTPEQAAKRRDEMAASAKARTAVHFECARCPEQFAQLKELFDHRAATHKVEYRSTHLQDWAKKPRARSRRAAIKGRKP